MHIMNNRWSKKKKLRGYTFSDLELWNASDTMAEFLLAILKEYKNMPRHGYPDMDEEVNSLKKWEAMLDKFIYTFDQIARGYLDSPHNIASKCMCDEHPDAYEWTIEETDKDLSQMKFTREDLHDQYFTNEVYKKEEQYRAEIAEGLRLFGKYFEAIWD